MESFKVAYFCWESMYGERVGGLASAATNLAETLVKQNHEVHFFTRGSDPGAGDQRACSTTIATRRAATSSSTATI